MFPRGLPNSPAVRKALPLAKAMTNCRTAKANRKVLEPFGQVADVYTRGRGGTGLGLPLTKSLIEAHGGELGIESVAGQCTTVTVRFPADRVIRAGVTVVGAKPAGDYWPLRNPTMS